MDFGCSRNTRKPSRLCSAAVSAARCRRYEPSWRQRCERRGARLLLLKRELSWRLLDAVRDMKNILFNAGVLVLVGSFAHLSVCQNQTDRPGATSLSDCTHEGEAVDKPADISIEQIFVAPVLGKTSNPKTGVTASEVSWETVVVKGRRAGDKRCILREDWDNTQASVDNENLSSQ
jgi:hypothetical protein